MSGNSGAIARQAEQAVLERVALAIQNELPALNVEMVMSEEGGRMYRLSHPTYLEEPIYLHVQASAFGKVIAAKVLEGKGIMPEAKAGANFCEAQAHKGGGRGICGHVLDNRGQCGMARMHVE